MNKLEKSKSNTSPQDKIIQKALRTGGFVFPETIDEVKEFERIYGSTDVILPSELQEPNFLYSKMKKVNSIQLVRSHSENLAMAAREGSLKIPPDIQKRMEADRKKADGKGKGIKWNKV